MKEINLRLSKKDFYISLIPLLFSIIATPGFSQALQKGDVIIQDKGFIYLADEPGIVPCPDLSCDIPIDLKIFKQHGRGYSLISTNTLSTINSNDHRLYKHQDRLASVFFNRQQLGDEQRFTTQMKVYDVSAAAKPSLWQHENQNGSLIDSALRDDQLFTLSLSRHDGTKVCDRAIDEPKEISGSDKKLGATNLEFTLSSLSLEKAGQFDEKCIAASINSLYNAALHVAHHGIYILFSTASHTQIHRYVKTKYGLSYAGYLTTDLLQYTGLIEQQLYEHRNALLVASEYTVEGDRHTGIQVFNLARKNDKGEYPLISTLGLGNAAKGSDANLTAITAAENTWYIATEQVKTQGGAPSSASQNNPSADPLTMVNDTDSYAMYVVDLTKIGKPFIHDYYESKARINKIMPVASELFALFQDRIGEDFNLVSSLNLIDTENKGKVRSVYTQDLTQGFTHRALPTVDERTLRARFDAKKGRGLLFFPVSDLIYAPPYDIPTAWHLDLLSFDLIKEKHCTDKFNNCWKVVARDTYELTPPYEGPEPSKARAFFRGNIIDYFFGSQIISLDEDSAD